MMNNRLILKGDIFHIKSGDTNPIGDEQWSDRPAVVVSNDIANKHSGVITIVYLKTDRHRRVRPTQVPVKSCGKDALALCEQVFTVDKSRVAQYMGHISEDELKLIESALLVQFGINPTARPITIFRKWQNYIDKYHIDSDANTPTNHNNSIPDADYTAILEQEIATLKGEVQQYKSLYLALKDRLKSATAKKTKKA